MTSEREAPAPEPTVEEFLESPERPLSAWRWLWEGDHRFPLPRYPGWMARLKDRVKRRVRRWVLGTQVDLWERQRVYNLRLLEDLEETPRLYDALRATADEQRDATHAVAQDLQRVQAELVRDVKNLRDAGQADIQELYASLQKDIDELRETDRQNLGFLQALTDRLEVLEGLKNEGFEEVMRHTDALFARVDQRFDDYRRSSRRLWGELGGLLAAAELGGAGRGGAEPLIVAAEDRRYLALERLFRGEESDIERRIEPYLEFLEGRGEVLDLGCGRGEALELLARRGIVGRGVDSNGEMIAACSAKGLTAAEGDLFEALAAEPAGELGGVVSFHVIEHLPPADVDRLVRLAFRALGPGGVLVLETPNPLSLVVAARNFWIDPTHRRPVHPETLRFTYEQAGFTGVERIDRQPFSAADRLPEIDLAALPAEHRRFAEEVNRLRDDLDALLFGFQDYGMVGFKPGDAAASA